MVAKIIAVMSAKGGVGKTTAAVNIAAALSARGKKTLIVDANLETPHVAIYYGFVGYKYSVEDVLNNIVPVESAVYGSDFENLDILPSRVFKGLGDGNSKYKIINLFYHLKKLEKYYDFIVIDSKPSFDLDFVKAIRGVSGIIVSGPEITSIIEAKKLNDELSGSNVNVLGLVLNRYDRKQKDIVNKEDAEKLTNIDVVWVVPEDKSIYTALKKGVPAVLLNGRLGVSKAFFEIAKSLIE